MAKSKFYSKDEAHFQWVTWGKSAQQKKAPSENVCLDGNDAAMAVPQHELHVSNDQCPVIDGLSVVQSLLSVEEADELVEEINKRDFTSQGFTQRRRVQQYSDIPPRNNSDGSTKEKEEERPIPGSLRRLMDRIAEQTGHWPQRVSVEEYSTQQTLKVTQYGYNGYNGILTSFETSAGESSCPCLSSSEQPETHGTGNCRCFVAYLPLLGSAVTHWNRPVRRHPTCFQLDSPQHWNDVRLDPQSLMIQTGDSLWNWRSRVSALPTKATSEAACQVSSSNGSFPLSNGTEHTNGDIQSPDNASGPLQHSTFFILKFSSLPPNEDPTGTSTGTADGQDDEEDVNGDGNNDGNIDYDAFGFMGKKETSICSLPMPPLEDVLTIIVTTSPIKSNPSTEVIEKTFESFTWAGDDFAVKCRKVIVCDGCRRMDDVDSSEKVSRRHVNIRQAMRNGIVSESQSENYDQFKATLRQLCADAAAGSDSSPFCNTFVEELDSRHGYGFALRHALRHCVTTPYVCVIQHDRTFMRRTPMLEAMRAMWRNRYIKYITVSMRSNLMYRDLFIGKYGKTYSEEYDEMILRLPELNLDAALYGPEGRSVEQMTCDNPKVLASIQSLVEKYKGSTQYQVHHDWVKVNPPADPNKHQLTLSPVSLLDHTESYMRRRCCEVGVTKVPII